MSESIATKDRVNELCRCVPECDTQGMLYPQRKNYLQAIILNAPRTQVGGLLIAVLEAVKAQEFFMPGKIASAVAKWEAVDGK